MSHRLSVAVAAVALTSVRVAHAGPALPLLAPAPPARIAPPAAAAGGGGASVSHLIYLNDCLPDGCLVHPGFDDSRTDTSSIPNQPSLLPAYPHGGAHWDQLVERVRQIYAPFDIAITTVDPGDADHFEVMIGGTSTDVGVADAGGVAPFIPCFGNLEDNVISFVFAETSSDLDYLSGAVAQETAHVFGLDHELDPSDAMTYLELGTAKLFTDNDVQCGEFDPRQCRCGASTQNSYEYLMDEFGPRVPVAPVVDIVQPRDGAWVLPGFPIYVNVESFPVPSTTIEVDGLPATLGGDREIVANAPVELPSGEVQVVVTSTNDHPDAGTATISVNVAGACEVDGEPCADGTVCLGGHCVPDQGVTGGLGATCAEPADCLFGTCAAAGEEMRCTMSCDEGEVCPDGYYCRSAGDSGVCWAGEAPSGGCDAGGGGGAAAGLLLVGLLLGSRPRRRAAA
jgi:hypothetical protein